MEKKRGRFTSSLNFVKEGTLKADNHDVHMHVLGMLLSLLSDIDVAIIVTFFGQFQVVTASTKRDTF